MAKNEDELLMGTPVVRDKAARDSDGDGVSDVEEELAGTDPNAADPALKPRETIDPRDDLDGPNLDREVAFDPAANLPDGQSLAGGLDGLTNLDGTDLTAGPSHHGVGEDSLLQGRDTHSPLDMDRSPLGGDGGQAGPGSGGDGPALSGRGPNWDLVSDEDDLDLHDKPDETPAPPAPIPDSPEPPAPPPVDEDGYPIPPDPGPPPRPPVTPDLGPDDMRDPDSGGGTPTDGEIDRAIIVRGGDAKPYNGDGGAPKIDADAPPPDKRDLVTDGGDENVDLGPTGTLTGRPDAPVVRTINPNSGVTPPPTSPGAGGGGSDADIGRAVDHTAAALGGDGLQQMDGTPAVAGVGDSHLEIDPALAPDDGMDQQQDEGSFAGPLDDGFD